MIRSKRKKVVIEGIFKIWISIFGTAGKFSVDNGNEFDNEDFRSMCENFNIRICTTAAESSWSNGLVERHDAVLGNMLTKIMAEQSCSLEVADAWAISAKNSFKNVRGFSPNQLVFGSYPNFPNAMNNAPPALEGKNYKPNCC